MEKELSRIPSWYWLKNRFHNRDGILCQYIPFKVDGQTTKLGEPDKVVWVQLLEGPNAGDYVTTAAPDGWQSEGVS